MEYNRVYRYLVSSGEKPLAFQLLAMHLNTALSRTREKTASVDRGTEYS